MKVATLCTFIILISKFLFSQGHDTIRLGEQVWMKKNLNIEAEDSFCYGNDEKKCEIFGRLYNWKTANEICPEGFRLASDKDWTELSEFLGGLNEAGYKLLMGGSSGFNALLGGNYNKNLDIFSYIYRQGYYWTSTPYNATTAWMRQFSNHQVNINRSTVKNDYYFSVRCIKN